MRSRRLFVLNNSIVHGICNYNCGLCSIGKPAYQGPRAFQSLDMARRIVSRVHEACQSGMGFLGIGLCGGGEPTLHPDFDRMVALFSETASANPESAGRPLHVAVVTNGSQLHNPAVLGAFIGRPITLTISFPTCNPLSYGTIMMGDPNKGEALLRPVIEGLGQVFKAQGQGKLHRVLFHLSPPERELVRRDFESTVSFLTKLARQHGVDRLSLVMFPAVSNRIGRVRARTATVDMYADLFRRFHRKSVNGVNVSMMLSYRRIYPRLTDVVDLLRHFDYPCMWNGHLFITPDGSSICSNDQSARHPMGNIVEHSLTELVEFKERYRPGALCASCNQKPEDIRGGLLPTVFSTICRLKAAFCRAPFAPDSRIVRGA